MRTNIIDEIIVAVERERERERERESYSLKEGGFECYRIKPYRSCM